MFNASPRPRAEVVEAALRRDRRAGGPGARRRVQRGVRAGRGLGVRAAGGREPPAPVTVTATPHGQVLDNGLVRVEIDGDGLLASVHDLTAGREVLAPGERGNLLQLHTDLPNPWDAWDIDRHYLHRTPT